MNQYYKELLSSNYALNTKYRKYNPLIRYGTYLPSTYASVQVIILVDISGFCSSSGKLKIIYARVRLQSFPLRLCCLTATSLLYKMLQQPDEEGESGLSGIEEYDLGGYNTLGRQGALGRHGALPGRPRASLCRRHSNDLNGEIKLFSNQHLLKNIMLATLFLSPPMRTLSDTANM